MGAQRAWEVTVSRNLFVKKKKKKTAQHQGSPCLVSSPQQLLLQPLRLEELGHRQKTCPVPVQPTAG